ncbi:MAG: PulJ/GspJ family protein [Oligoflexus sp.]
MKVQSNHNSGYSLIEVLIAMGLLTALMAFGLTNFNKTQELRVLVEDRSVITNLEEDIRRAVYSNVALAITAREDQNLLNCLQLNNRACRRGLQDLVIYAGEERILTGKYDGALKKCDGLNCLVEVKTQFQGVCGEVNACDQAKYLIFQYQILADGVLLRSSQLRRSLDRASQSDDNLACDLDQVGRTQFVNQLRPSSVNCIDSPPLNRQVQGVQAGDCKPGLEILAGFDAAGAPICQPIKYSVGNNRP